MFKPNLDKNMNTQRPQFNLNNFKLCGAISCSAGLQALVPLAIILVSAAPIAAQIVTIENRSTIYHPPVNNSIIYGSPISPPVNSSIIYGSPIPAPVIIAPSNFYAYPNYYPSSVTRVIDTRTTLTDGVLINPTIRNSTLINPTIIIQPQRRYRAVERNQTILRPINY